jgi:hypothetical protein
MSRYKDLLKRVENLEEDLGKDTKRKLTIDDWHPHYENIPTLNAKVNAILKHLMIEVSVKEQEFHKVITSKTKLPKPNPTRKIKGKEK